MPKPSVVKATAPRVPEQKMDKKEGILDAPKNPHKDSHKDAPQLLPKGLPNEFLKQSAGRHAIQLADLILTLIKEYRPSFYALKRQREDSKDPQRVSDNPQNRVIAAAIEQKCRDACKAAMEQDAEIRKKIIDQLYQNLVRNYQPWEKNKGLVLAIYKPIFNYLIHQGATFHWMNTREDPERQQIFDELLNHVLEEELLAEVLKMPLSEVALGGGEFGFGWYKSRLNTYLPLGASIQALSANREAGTYLHAYLAAGGAHAKELLQLIESKRDLKAPKTQFRYTERNAEGLTPLLLAILTCNESAALALLDHNRRGIIVGINAQMSPGAGPTPVMLAAALGMVAVVRELLEQGADVSVKDQAGKGLDHYSQLDEAALQSLLCRWHPQNSSQRTQRVQPRPVLPSDAALTCQGERCKEVLAYLKCYKENEPFLRSIYDEAIINANIPGVSYDFVLHSIDQSLSTKIQTCGQKLKPHIAAIQNLITVPRPKESLVEAYREGQIETLAYLQSPEAQALIAGSKERALRWSSAIGEQKTVYSLLEEGVDPHAMDNQGRTAMDYAGARLEVVKQRLREVRDDRADPIEQKYVLDRTEVDPRKHPDYIRAEAGLRKHPDIIKALLSHSLLRIPKAKAQIALRTALRADLENSENPLTREIAEACLSALDETAPEPGSQV